MKFYSLLLLLLVYGNSFSQKRDSLLALINSTEITSLSSIEKQKEFLLTIFDADQAIRAEWEIANEQLEKESEEYIFFLKKLNLTDSILFVKTREYLDVFKYPSDKHSDLACYTPQLIFHHASVFNFQNLIELKSNYFPMFYQAYKNNDLKEGSIWFYLFRLHQQVKKQNYVNYDLGEEAQIEEMIDLLKLKKN